MTGIYISIAGLALAIGGVILRGGILIGETRARDEQHGREQKQLREELAAIKASLDERTKHGITREELDARFAELRVKIESVGDRMSDAVDVLREAMRR
jgi:uncharacterized membrane-anchored protein YhcB (DUF1043 family)